MGQIGQAVLLAMQKLLVGVGEVVHVGTPSLGIAQGTGRGTKLSAGATEAIEAAPVVRQIATKAVARVRACLHRPRSLRVC